MSILSDRYVEVTYDLGNKKTNFRAIVIEAESPNEALKLAKRDLLKEHPDATNIEEFMQRRLEPHKAYEILEQMRAGTWEGWDFSR